MSEIITTLHKKDDASVNVYPNIKSDNIPSGAVSEDKIADGAVTEDKIGDRSVTGEKIATSTIDTGLLNFYWYENYFYLTVDNYAVLIHAVTIHPLDTKAKCIEYLQHLFGYPYQTNLTAIIYNTSNNTFINGFITSYSRPPLAYGIELTDSTGETLKDIVFTALTDSNIDYNISKPMY